MISNYYFEVLDKANQQLSDQWNLLVNVRSENGNIDKNKLQQVEMAYFQSLQLVIHAVESAINSQDSSQHAESDDNIQ